ncbi:MAG: nucleoside triphosphate pyrophosphatase [Calditrichaceae bacterium]
MIFSLIENLDKVDVILASTSPRRYELLKTIGLEFKIVASGANESNDENLDPVSYALENARKKACAVTEKHPNSLIISADTIVILDGIMMGKPVNEDDAYRMISALSGKTHKVCTAFGLAFKRYDKSFYDTVETEVTFRELTEEEIWEYINTGEPFDKAGAYAIQGQGSILVEKINGCFFNVVGFPLSKFFTDLDKFLAGLVL